jgi:hypothetical protein
MPFDSGTTMKSTFEQTLIEVWRQALVENAKVVVLGTERYPVRRTCGAQKFHPAVFNAGRASAIARARAQLPQAELPLSQRDAQLVLARECGFPGWQTWLEK